MKLISKIKIKGTIKTVTGLHIGGNKSTLEIGGVDLNVIKTGKAVPFIPGSSLKGKLLSLLAKAHGSPKKEQDPEILKMLFGDEGGVKKKFISQLQVRDALLDQQNFNSTFGEFTTRSMDFEFSEVKSENTIDRIKSNANPRQVERVPAGTIFNFTMILDIFEGQKAEVLLAELRRAFTLLEWDYLGGHGSRGSGEVTLSVTDISGKDITKDSIGDFSSRQCQEYLSLFK